MGRRILGCFLIGIFLILTLGAVNAEQGYNYLEALSQSKNGCSVTVTSIDSASFPEIKASLRILDANGDPIPNLTESNFSLREEHPVDGTANIGIFQVIPQGGGYVSAGLVMDCSGSMSGQKIEDAKQAAKDFIANFKANDRGAILRFSSNYDVKMLQAFTSDKTLLNSAIDSLSAGGMTALFDAIALGVEETAPEVHNKAVIAFTDGKENDSVNYPNLNDLINHIVPFNIPAYTIGLGSYVDEANLIEIATQTGGQYYFAPDASDLADIYNEIAKGMAVEYLLAFRSPHPFYDGTTRTVYIDVSTPYGICSASFQYTVASPIVIERTPDTVDLSSHRQEPGIPLTIKANITGGTATLSASLFYRKSGTSTFYDYEMVNSSGDLFEYTIPGSNVMEPGVDYYITATDGVQSVSDPAQDPADYPYSIPVKPNYAPFISHSPITSGCQGQEITIDTIVVDDTDYVEKVRLFYKSTSEVLYDSISMSPMGGDTYQATIPGSEVTLDGIDYYIRATDNNGVSAYHGFAYDPHHIDISVCGGLLFIWTDKQVYNTGDTLSLGIRVDNRGGSDIPNAGFTLSLKTPYGPVVLMNISHVDLYAGFYYEEPKFISAEISPYLPLGDYVFVAAITAYSFPVAIDCAEWQLTGPPSLCWQLSPEEALSVIRETFQR